MAIVPTTNGSIDAFAYNPINLILSTSPATSHRDAQYLADNFPQLAIIEIDTRRPGRHRSQGLSSFAKSLAATV